MLGLLPAATEHSVSRHRWHILGFATAAEHSALVDEDSCDNICPDGTRYRVVSIGSVQIRHDVFNETMPRVLAVLQREVHHRLHLHISSDEMTDYCSRSATEQTNTSVHGRNRDLCYNKHSYSGTIEAISRCVAAYHRAADAFETSACDDIMNKLTRHVRALLEKCVPNAYLQEYVMDVITDYIWNRSCNVALHRVLDDILTSHAFSSQQELSYVVDLLEACVVCVRTSGDEILAELSHYRRSATEQTTI